MGFFKTKDPKTGEPRLGAGVYLIICALMIGGVVLWNVRKNANDPGFIKSSSQTTSSPRNPSNLQAVATAAETHQEEVLPSQTDVKPQTGEKYSLGKGPNIDPTKNILPETEDNVDTIENTLSILRQNKERAEKEKAEAVAKAKAESEDEIARLRKRASVSQEEPTRATRPPSGRDQSESVNVQSLVVYDAKRDTRTSAQQAKAAVQVVPTGFETYNFLPRGWLFPVYILSTVQTVNQEDIVIMGVAENIIFQHKVQIPFGTRLLGSAAGLSFEDRIAINVDTILYPDGRELPLSAFLKDANDLSSGVRGYYIPQPIRVQLAPYVSQFIDTWSKALAERYIGDSGDSESTREALDQTSDLISDQAKKIQERLDRRYPEKVVVPIGTKAYVQLRAPLDLTQAQIAGSLGNRQPVLPGYENNPISAGGMIERTANYSAPVPGQVTSTSPTNAALSSSPTVTQAVEESSAQTQSYINAIQKLNALNDQINSMKKNSSSSGTASRINWPEGDIQ